MRKFLRKNPVLVKLVRKIRQSFSVYKNNLRLKLAVRTSPLNIVVGASGKFNQGWIPTDIENLDLLTPSSWSKYFKKNSINVILAEHVWEHLSLEEGLLAARQCYMYLKPSGYLRIAVPDGNHPDKKYIQHVDIGSDDHKVLYDYKIFCELFEKVGFEVQLLEYFDENHKFHCNKWDANKGMIIRSKRFDERNLDGELNYTSIIIDAYKII